MTSSELTWMKNAKCTGKTNLFFSHEGEKSPDRRRRERLAVLICRSCSAMYECRDYARSNNELGVWGGETEDQRYSLGYLRDPFMRRKFRDREKRQLIRESIIDASVSAVSEVSEDA